MPRNTFEQIIGQPEGQTLEYKTVVPPPSLVARIVASFANSDGGFLICGVRDDLIVQGIADEVPAPSIIDSALARLNPRPTVNHYFAEVEGKRLYVLEVAKSSHAVTTEQGVIYSRVGDHTITSRLATEGEGETRSQHEIIAKLLNELEAFKVKASEAKQRLIEQYINLTQLIERSTPILCPEKTSLVTNKAEGKVLARLLLSSFADSFENYVTNLLFEIYLAKPETLKTSSPVTVQEVLDCFDMEAFIRFVATRKISGLKKGNVKGLIEENKQIQNLEVFSDSIIKEIDEIFQTRHLYVHSNGRVDSKFANSVSGEYQIGDEHNMTIDEICNAANLLSTTADQLDRAAIAKYGLSISEL
jgi:hypothetical protein